MTIYTAASCDDLARKSPDRCVCGSYTTKEDGRAQVDLHDGRGVSCVLRRDDADNIKERKR